MFGGLFSGLANVGRACLAASNQASVKLGAMGNQVKEMKGYPEGRRPQRSAPQR